MDAIKHEWEFLFQCIRFSRGRCHQVCEVSNAIDWQRCVQFASFTIESEVSRECLVEV